MHGDQQTKIWWHGLPEWGEKAKGENLELWHNRPFPERPLQRCTVENMVEPGTLWTGRVLRAWLLYCKWLCCTLQNDCLKLDWKFNLKNNLKVRKRNLTP